MRAGQLRRRVQLQAFTNSTDAEGTPIEGWSTVRSVWAAVRAVSTQERLMAAQAGVTTTHQVTMRYAADVTHNHRLLEGARVLEIQTVTDPDERHESLELVCSEVIPD